MFESVRVIDLFFGHYDALHLQKIKLAKSLSDICAIWGRSMMPPWLKTRSTGVLEAGTAKTLMATRNSAGRVFRFIAQNESAFCPSDMSM